MNTQDIIRLKIMKKEKSVNNKMKKNLNLHFKNNLTN